MTEEIKETTLDFAAEAADIAGSITGTSTEPPSDQGDPPGAEPTSSPDGAPPSPSDDAAAAGKAPAGSPPPTKAGEAPPKDDAAGPEAPATWTPEAKALWATLPPAAKVEITRREQEAAQLGTAYGKAAKVAGGFQAIFEPHMEFLKATGVNPWVKTQELWGAYRLLTEGTPEQKAEMLTNLAAAVGINMEALAAGGQNPFAKSLQNMVNRLERVEGGIHASQARALAEANDRFGQEIDAFAADTKAHPYFWEVANDVTFLLSSGRHRTLDGAYAEAVRMNPLTHAKELERQFAERTTAAAKEAEEKAKAARKASGANLRQSLPSARGVPAKSKSMDDTLNAAMDAIEGRTS